MLKKIKQWLLERRIKKKLGKMTTTPHGYRIPAKCSSCELLYVNNYGWPTCTSEHNCIYAPRRVSVDDRETKQGVSNRSGKMR